MQSQFERTARKKLGFSSECFGMKVDVQSADSQADERWNCIENSILAYLSFLCVQHFYISREFLLTCLYQIYLVHGLSYDLEKRF